MTITITITTRSAEERPPPLSVSSQRVRARREETRFAEPALFLVSRRAALAFVRQRERGEIRE